MVWPPFPPEELLEWELASLEIAALSWSVSSSSLSAVLYVYPAKLTSFS